MAQRWYNDDELKNEADTAQRPFEWDPEATPDDPEDTSWEKMDALFARDTEIRAAVATITKTYRTEDDEFFLLEDGTKLEWEANS